MADSSLSCLWHDGTSIPKSILITTHLGWMLPQVLFTLVSELGLFQRYMLLWNSKHITCMWTALGFVHEPFYTSVKVQMEVKQSLGYSVTQGCSHSSQSQTSPLPNLSQSTVGVSNLEYQEKNSKIVDQRFECLIKCNPIHRSHSDIFLIMETEVQLSGWRGFYLC